MDDMSTGSDKLSPQSFLIIALTVFALHFGAACMLWPTTWGRDSGADFPLAFAGFFISGIILPWLGYLAISKSGGTMYALTEKVDRKFCLFYGGLTVCALGPLFAVPRMSAASWEACSRLLPEQAAATSGFWLMPVLFMVVFYSVALWFFYNERTIVRKLSRLLVPVLVAMEVLIIGMAVVSPIGEPVARNYTESPVAYGFLNGYQTMDLVCALMFSGILIQGLRARLPSAEPSRINYYFVLTGLAGFLIMGAIQFGEMYRGSLASGVFPDTSYAHLSVSIIFSQLGYYGGALFTLCLVLASLTTAVGLLAGTAAFLSEALNGRLSYQSAAKLSFAVALLVSCSGFDFIFTWATPLLQFVYPPCIALVLCTVLPWQNATALRWSCLATTVWAIADTLAHYCELLGWYGVKQLMDYVPGYGMGIAFVWFMVGGWLLGRLKDGAVVKTTDAVPQPMLSQDG